jgi:hypothetical protein
MKILPTDNNLQGTSAAMLLVPGLPFEILRRIVSLLGAPYSWSD